MPDARTFVDALFAFEAGVNNNISPLLLQKNQLASAVNTTVRGTFVGPRSAFKKIAFDDSLIPSPFLFQGVGFYNPDTGLESMIAAISGRTFKFLVDGDAVTLSEITIGGKLMDSTNYQHWFWQAEKWMIHNDGQNLPQFYDDSSNVQSNFSSAVNFSTTTTTAVTFPAIGSNATVEFTSIANLVVGDLVTIQNKGTFLVLELGNPNPTSVTFVNVSLLPVGQVAAIGSVVSWTHIGTQLPPGRMGAYGMGRNWICLVDGKQFVAGDIVGGSSGTVALNYRDAVLNVTENNYLAGGGNFTVPGSIGDITFMKFSATLDASLGQGALLVGTHNTVFSVNTPVDRLTWQDLTNPILTESVIGHGGLGQENTILANSDIICRSVDGILSVKLARRDFDTWGNTLISQEVYPLIKNDSPSLLQYGTAANFDNRLLESVSPVLSDYGIYHQGLIPLNFDPVSSLRGKAPSVYDSLVWTGLNVFKLVTGEFRGIFRCFAFTFNAETNKLELYEILNTGDAIYDNGDTPITWEFESASLNFGEVDPRTRTLKRLVDGEIYIDQLQGTVEFEAWYKPDQWPCWIPWFNWSECANANTTPQFRPRMGLGEPSPKPCDAINDRPMREAYTFQFKLVVTGQCRFLGSRFKAVQAPEPMFAKQQCSPICPT